MTREAPSAAPAIGGSFQRKTRISLTVAVPTEGSEHARSNNHRDSVGRKALITKC
jgi:hypothetical protein